MAQFTSATLRTSVAGVGFSSCEWDVGLALCEGNSHIEGTTCENGCDDG